MRTMTIGHLHALRHPTAMRPGRLQRQRTGQSAPGRRGRGTVRRAVRCYEVTRCALQFGAVEIPPAVALRPVQAVEEVHQSAPAYAGVIRRDCQRVRSEIWGTVRVSGCQIEVSCAAHVMAFGGLMHSRKQGGQEGGDSNFDPTHSTNQTTQRTYAGHPRLPIRCRHASTPREGSQGDAGQR